MKKVLVLGGGVGGTRVANGLARRGVGVTVADSHGDHLYQPAYLYLPFGIVYENTRDGRSLLRPEVEYRVEKRADRDVPPGYDALVIATGSKVDKDAMLDAHHFHCRHSALELRDALAMFDGGKLVVGATRLPYKCPPSPVEFALLADEWLREQKLRDRTEIFYVYPLPRALPLEPAADASEALFRERGIRFLPSFVPQSVDNRILTAADGRRIPFDLLVLVPPHMGSLGAWIPVNPETLQAKPRVYALGDAAELPVPKSGSAAHFQADVVVQNVIDELEGRAPSARYDGRVMCFCETGGGKAMRIEFTYRKPPGTLAPSLWAHRQKRLLNRFYYRLAVR